MLLYRLVCITDHNKGEIEWSTSKRSKNGRSRASTTTALPRSSWVSSSSFSAGISSPRRSCLRTRPSAPFWTSSSSSSSSLGFLANRIVRFFKRRITYPRTGYVTFKKKEPSPKRRIATAVVAAIISASLAALYGLSPSFKALYPAVNGLLFGVAVLLLRQQGRPHCVSTFSPLSSAVIGVAVTAAGIGDIKGHLPLLRFFGTALILSGLAALIVYLRRSPRPSTEASEGPDAH